MLDHNIEVIKRAVKKDMKCEACRDFLCFFCDKLNKLNNTGARLLGSIYHITTLKLCLKNAWNNDLMLHIIIRKTNTDRIT